MPRACKALPRKIFDFLKEFFLLRLENLISYLGVGSVRFFASFLKKKI